MENIFAKYIREGRVRNHEQLRAVYHQLLMHTHPDATGTDQSAESFIGLGQQYSEARQLLDELSGDQASTVGSSAPNVRLSFFRHLEELDRLDMPFTFDRRRLQQQISAARAKANQLFEQWRPQQAELYSAAQRSYDQIKHEKHWVPYTFHTFYFNLRPVFHNITAYHLTGLPLYKKQLRQNLDAILHHLELKHHDALRDYILFLIQDIEDGPALFD